MGLLDDLDKRRGQVEITNENSARLAHAYGTATTTGQGTCQVEDSIEFGTAFVELPHVSHCSVVDIDDLSDLLGVEDPPLPHVSGFVTDWDQDERGFYVGAWVAAKVSFDTLDAVDIAAQPVIEHHFTFSAIAIKDIPIDVTDAAVD